MEFHRRDLLKHFGIGAVVAPIVAGKPNLELPARLLAVPKVELIEAKAMPDFSPVVLADVKSISVVFEFANGSRRTILGDYLFQRDGYAPGAKQLQIDIQFREEAGGSPLHFRTTGKVSTFGMLA